MDKVVHFEIPAVNLDRANKFYSKIFGWKIEKVPMGQGEPYYIVHTVETDKQGMPQSPGAINGGISSKAQIPYPIVVIDVKSIDETIKKIQKEGGKINSQKVNVMGMGYYARVVDLEGNIIGLWENIPKK